MPFVFLHSDYLFPLFLKFFPFLDQYTFWTSQCFVRHLFTTFRILNLSSIPYFFFKYVVNRSRITSLFLFPFLLPASPRYSPSSRESLFITAACMYAHSCTCVHKYINTTCQSHFCFCVFMVSSLTTLH